ncbi:MAG: MBL fold metallo-hydrolase [Halobacteriales archaeon]|nr:MBL fold metallo-hydrolase [Halobacteriales archaeon]
MTASAVEITVEVLGIAQDAGVPHIGCGCEVCTAARTDPTAIRYATAVLLRVGEPPGGRYLIDATPDIRFQLDAATVSELDGIVLTHVHLGHVGGLPYLGTEALDADELAVYCTPSVASYLETNGPYRQLVERGQIDIRSRSPGESLGLPPSGLQVGSIEVPHRGETDTVAIRLAGPERELLYLSDIDAWTDETLESVRTADVALIDGTFWRKDELDRIEEVPHPAIVDSMDRLETAPTDVRFIHLNHTNPALRPESVERSELEDRGFSVAERGDTIDL